MGKIIFSTNEKLFSKGIRDYTKSDVSHVAFLLDDETVTHSTLISGVSKASLAQFKREQKIIKVFEVDDIFFKKAQKVFKEKDSQNYGYFDILYLAISLPIRRFITFKNPIQDGLICSEYAALYLDECYHVGLYHSSHPLAPSEVLKWCERFLKEVSI